MTNEEMTRSKQIAMMKDKLAYELAAVNKQCKKKLQYKTNVMIRI